MRYMKSLAEILGRSDDKSEEVYTTDQKKRKARSNKGRYTRNKGVFSFINLMQSWDSIVGDFMAQNTIPLKLKKNVLYVSTKHSIFAQELGFLSQDIIRKIDETFPDFKGEIKNIKFLHSMATQKMFEGQPKPNDTKVPFKKLHPQSPQYKQRKKECLELLADIEDEEVKQALMDFMLEQ